MVYIISEILQALRAAELHAIADYAFRQFPRLREPMVTVGLTAYTHRPASLDGVLYRREDGTACYGCRIVCTVQLQCYFPYREGANNCPAYLERVFAAVKNGRPYLKTCGIEAGPVEYRPDEDGFCCKILLRVDMFREEGSTDA